MNNEKKDVRKGELKDEELEEISGGMDMPNFPNCHCPRCNKHVKTKPGMPCVYCAFDGVTSYVVLD